jgi:hypothetical protein
VVRFVVCEDAMLRMIAKLLALKNDLFSYL